jgi:demethylmenaquinone methyltransferase/2-methoxy-6-polyprenyl-1,4-benzoquinol methylase
MFDAIAERYDLLNHLLSAGIDRRWRKRAIRALALTGRERVVDLCTGTGDLAIAAVQAKPAAARVVGIDFAPAMLNVGLKKIRERRLGGRVHLVRGDAARVPIADAAADAVTIAFGMRNIESVATACAEMRRVLIRGGRFAILEFGMPDVAGVRQLYSSYFKHVLPRVGRLISRHDAAYEYLPASVGAFARPAEFLSTLRHHGFVEVSAVRLTLGIVWLYTGRRG